jgi:hypothetical protein
MNKNAEEYLFLSLLKNNNELTKEINNYENIKLCVYSIDRSSKYPFLKYLLVKSEYATILTLPSVSILKTFNKDNLEYYLKIYLSGLLLVKNFEAFDNNIILNGYYEFEDNLYIFYDISDYMNILEKYIDISLKMALIDEIINTTNIYNISIDYSVTRFFILNSDINYLYNTNGEQYEIPIVGYNGKSSSENMNFTMIFGETSKDKNAIMGPFYYFTDFNNSVRKGGWSKNFKPEYKFNKLLTDNDHGRYIKGGVIRFALFLGKTKYIENLPNDKYDESEIKNERIQDETMNKKYELLTSRISDHAGKWAEKYDSVYLSKIELDDGSYLEDTPLIVLKNYDQQVPLTYHFINKGLIGEKYDSTKKYYSI